jgi:uridine monophosphate synthetase
MQQQLLNNGSLAIAKWADVVTVHSVPGAASVQSLSQVIDMPSNRLKGVLLVAQMSTDGSLTDEAYIQSKLAQL